MAAIDLERLDDAALVAHVAELLAHFETQARLNLELHGGDMTRNRKLLDKQKEGKKRMRQFGKVEIPQEAFIEALKMGD